MPVYSFCVNLPTTNQTYAQYKQRLRVNRSTLWRRQLKEKDPEKYRRYLEQQRVRSQVARNRLKLAISMVKSSPMKMLKIDRHKKQISERNTSGVRGPQLTNLPNNDFSSEKADEPKIVLDKLPHQIKIFKMFHILSSGVHLKHAQTLAQISVQYYWPTMREDVRKWVSDCKVCENQPTHTKKNIALQSDGSTSWQLTSLSDLDGNSGSWSKETTKILLQAVAKIFGRRPLHIQTELDLWTEIAKAVNMHGTNIPAVTCKLKWQEMKKLYTHLKTGNKFSPNPSQYWSLYNIMDMIYKAFQTFTNETNMQPMFPFISIFGLTEADTDGLNNSNLTSESQMDQNNFPLNIYQNVYHKSSSMPNDGVGQVNQDQNLELKEICENNPIIGREQKNDFEVFDSSLKAVGRPYWNSDQMHTIAADSFELGANVDNSVSSLMLPLAADFNTTVDVITASELQQEIKQECNNLIETISFPPAPSPSVQENSTYVNNPLNHDTITFKMEPNENLENLEIQTNSRSGSDVLHSSRTKNIFSDQDVLCLEIVANQSENKLSSNHTKMSLSNDAKMSSLNQNIQSSSHDLNTVDLTYLSPEPEKNSISFSDDSASVVTSSKDDVENGNLSIATTSQSHRHSNKNLIEEELSPLKRSISHDKCNSLSPVSFESVSSNIINLGGSVKKNEEIPSWFQQYIKEQKQNAAEQEKRMKDFQDSLLGLVRETNQHLATLIYIQRNEMKEKEKKDDEFKNSLFNILKEKHK